jgi:hypothetical protein
MQNINEQLKYIQESVEEHGGTKISFSLAELVYYKFFAGENLTQDYSSHEIYETIRYYIE